MKYRIMFLFVCCLSFHASAAQGSLRDMLGLFMTVPESDSVAGVTGTDSSLLVTFVNRETGASRTENVSMNDQQRQKILTAYQEPQAATLEKPADTSSTESRDVSAQRRNHIGYVTGQTGLSYYVYSMVWPIGFEMNAKNASAISLITLPAFFASHYLFQKKYPLHDAHIAGINYLTTGFLTLTYSVPFAIVGNDNLWDAFRAAAVASMITYPIGIYCGYKLGGKNENNPGRIDLQSVFGWSGYALGLTSPMIYLGEDFEGELTRSVAFTSAMVFSVVGHFCGNRYLPNRTIPRGNPAGITSYGILGLALGLTADAWLEIDNLNANVGIPWASYLGGLAIGLNVFKDRNDQLERGTYNSLGMLAGTAAASGLIVLIEPEKAGTWATMLTAGAYAGYFLTSYVTRDLVDKADSGETVNSFQIHLSLAPDARVRKYQGLPVFTEYSIRPLEFRF